MTEEHRIAPRRRTLKGARISFANENCAVDCQIRNLSETGAGLIVPTTVGIPRCFTLTDLHASTRHRAECVWRKGERMGVRFPEAAAAGPAPALPFVPPPLAAPALVALPRAAARLRPRHLLRAKTPQTAN